MEFNPGPKTLLANYFVVLGVVIFAIFVGRDPANVRSYWYNPEYTSHLDAAYSDMSCASCHNESWKAASLNTCWSSGCHVAFDPVHPPANMLEMRTKENKKPDPNFGALLAFHNGVSDKMSCEACHPSHRLPTRGQLNAMTLAAGMTAANMPPATLKTVEIRKQKHSELFHAGAAPLFAGMESCQKCHVAPATEVHTNNQTLSCKQCHISTGTWKDVSAGKSAAALSVLQDTHQIADAMASSRWVISSASK